MAAPAPKRVKDEELAAMKRCAAIIESLHRKEALRVVKWLNDRYSTLTDPTKGEETD